MSQMKSTIHLIAAARPNFMKIAPLFHALKKTDWADPKIVHTGQHYDLNMSDVFFKDLCLPEPDIHLGVGSGTHAEQTGKVMAAYEKILFEKQPDIVIVVGDVNSTVACALAASKVFYNSGNSAGRPLIAHLEAGLRSRDRTMPEEINRLVTDVLSDILWTPSPDGDENLLKEGIGREKIVRVGNIMIDSLEMMRDKIEALSVYKEFELEKGNYGVITLHRPANVDNPDTLKMLCDLLVKISNDIPLVFPIHPRTRKNLAANGFLDSLRHEGSLLLVDPMSYIRFMNMVFNSRFVLTDSGGIQEETTYIGIPCLTMRPNTERPITVEIGTNRLCKLEEIKGLTDAILSNKGKHGTVPELWDGHTAERVVESARLLLNNYK